MLDPEAVLLIDHHHPERREANVVAQQCVGPHHHIHVTARQRLEDPLTLTALHPPGQQLHHDVALTTEGPVVSTTQPREVRSQGGRVLFGEHLGRRHESPLVAAFDGDEQRARGDDGLARAHVALQETVHRQRSDHVGADLAEHAALRARQGETMRTKEAREQRVRRSRHVVAPQVGGIEVVHNGERTRLETPTSQRDEQLEAKELVEGEASSGRLDVGGLLGQVQSPEGGGAFEQSPLLPTRGVDGIVQRTRSFERFLDEAPEFPARESRARRGRIHHDESPDLVRVALLPRRAHQDVDHGVGHLAFTAVLGDLGEEQRLDAFDELSRPPGLIEERDSQPARGVTRAHLHQ